MCRSMADIRSTAAEIRRGKKKIEEGRRKETTGQKYNGPLLHRAAIMMLSCTYYINIICSNLNVTLFTVAKAAFHSISQHTHYTQTPGQGPVLMCHASRLKLCNTPCNTGIRLITTQNTNKCTSFNSQKSKHTL